MRLRLAWVAALTLGLASIVIQCRSATQMIIEVTTDVPCSKLTGTSITVAELGGFDDKAPATVATTCTDGGTTSTIGSLVVTPSGDDDALIAFQVTAGVGKDPATCDAASPTTACIVARRSLRFIPHQTIRIEVPLRQDCAGVVCTPDTTCYSGGCVVATIDPAKCHGEICDEGSLGGAVDGGAAQVSSEAGIVDSGPIVTTTGVPDAQPDTTAPPSGDGGFVIPTDAGPTISSDGVTLVIGNDHGCLLAPSKKLYCWGSNDVGQLGNGSSDTGVVPVATLVPGMTDVTAVASGDNTVAAETSDGGLYMWGANNYGAIPPSTNYANPSPIRVNSAMGFDHFCVGRGHFCGVAGNTLQCWGSSEGYDNKAIMPFTYDLGTTVKAITCGDYGTVILTSAGNVLSFGESSSSLGRTTDAGVLPEAGTTPLPVTGNLPNIMSITSGEQDTFLFETGFNTLYGFGTTEGSIINETSVEQGVPVVIEPGFSGFSTIVVGNLFACGLRSNTVQCWGEDVDGALSVTPTGNRHTTPILVTLPTTAGAASNIWGRGSQTCVRTADANIYCWGKNNNGQLGIGYADGDGGAHPTPTRFVLPSQN